MISMPVRTYADPNHRWGLQPYHYTPAFYQSLSLEVENYVLSTELEEIALRREGVSLCEWGKYYEPGAVIRLQEDVRKFSSLLFVLGGMTGYIYQTVKVNPYINDPKNLHSFIGYAENKMFILQGKFISPDQFKLTFSDGGTSLGIRKIFGYK